MAETVEDICNLALKRVGCKKRVDDLEADQTPEAEACADVYATCRDKLLEMFAWPFAQRRATLAELDEAGDRDGEWAYAYALPDDCVQPQYIPTGVSRSAAKADRQPFRLEAGEANGDGEVDTTVLLTDAAEATLVYTARITNPTLYPAAFVDALAWLIATELTLSMTVQPRLLPLIEQKTRAALLLAQGLAVQSESPDVEPESKFTTGRQ